MATEIYLLKDNKVKKAYLGFSWTFFFFGLFVPLFRKDYKNFFIFLIVAIIECVLLFNISSIFTIAILFIILIINIQISNYYNCIHTMKLLKNGYKPYNDFSKKVLEVFKIHIIEN